MIKLFFWTLFTLNNYPPNAEGVKLVIIEQMDSERMAFRLNTVKSNFLWNGKVATFSDVHVNVTFIDTTKIEKR